VREGGEIEFFDEMFRTKFQQASHAHFLSRL